MSTHDVVEAWKQQWIEEGHRTGVERGLAQGMKRGMERGMEQGTVKTLMGVYEARFGAVPNELRAALERIHDEAKLWGLTKLFGARSAEEIAEALLKTS